MTGPRKIPRPAAWRNLLAPLKYLRIRHAMKWRFDWGWPLSLTIFTVTVFWLLPLRPAILGDSGVLRGVRDLIALLAAFFVVALAAVATFAEKSLDEPMQGTTPTLAGVPLTRRQFVCYLFGYLATLSFAIFLLSVAAQILGPTLHALLAPVDPSKTNGWPLLKWAEAVAGTVFVFLFWNMIVTTLLGIYFLVERVHLPTAADAPNPAFVDDERITRLRPEPPESQEPPKPQGRRPPRKSRA